MACCGSCLVRSDGCVLPVSYGRHSAGMVDSLIASNHTSYLDIPLLGCGIPRRVWYMGGTICLTIPLLNGLLQALGWIPLRIGRLDREAFGKAVSLVQEGKAVAISRRGRTMTGALKPGKPGIGVIVSQTGCRVIPAHIGGTFDVLPPGATWPRFRRVTVSYGAPLISLRCRTVGRESILSTCQSDGDGEDRGTRQVLRIRGRLAKPEHLRILPPHQEPSLATLSKTRVYSRSAPGASRKTRTFS